MSSANLTNDDNGIILVNERSPLIERIPANETSPLITPIQGASPVRPHYGPRYSICWVNFYFKIEEKIIKINLIFQGFSGSLG
jgi:hypothetical protein